MRTQVRVKWLNVALIGLVTIALAVGMFWVFFQAVLQESFKNYPPTQAELQEDPSLAVYLEDAGK